MKHTDHGGVITPILFPLILLFLSTDGVLHHFTNRYSKAEDVFTKGHAAESISPSKYSLATRDYSKYMYEPAPAVRDPRQLMSGNPQAYTSNIHGDTHEFARTFYSGEGSKVIFVLTYDGQREGSQFRVTSSELYRSTDYGQTFQNQSNKLQSGLQLHNAFYRFPNNKDVIFSDTSRSVIYITTDEGETFSSRQVPVNPRTLKIHPSLSGWILGHDRSQGVLMYSEDSGTSWATVAQNVHRQGSSEYTVNDFSWGVPGIDWDINNPRQSDITKVFYSVIDRNAALSSSNSRILYVANNLGGGYVSKLFEPDLRYFYNFLVDGNFIFASQAIATSSESDKQYELYISDKRKPFNLARFPTTFSHIRYFVASHRSSQALVIIEHENTYNLYLSDETGVYYSLSLENLAVKATSSVDLIVIDSINGTMMASQFIVVNGQKRNRTMITFSNGAQWHRIPAPTYVDGEPARCYLPTCSLHFHMDSSSLIGVYSRNSAPGIIVAHGNFGPYLSDSGSVYITRNGGLTWEKTLDGTWHVETIDHGGLLVAAKDNHQDKSMTIRYSCNEGMSWSDFAFANSPIVVWGLHTEPGETTTQVLLLGTNSRSSLSTWIIIHINFTSVFLHSCQAFDYYNWTVSDGRFGNQQCLLGETRIIERRRAEVCCWNSRQYERVISATPCECTAADFECEWGYHRDENSKNCTLDPKCGPDLDCLTGYRKIPGDVCFRGVSSQYLSPRDCVSDMEYSSRCALGGTPESSDNDNSSSVIIIPIVVAVTAIILVSIIIASIYCIKKWKRKLCADKPVVMQKANEGPPPKPTKNHIWIAIANLRQPSKKSYSISNHYY